MFKRSTKQLDKLHQWTGETFFKDEKTEVSQELQEFESEAEVHRNGLDRLQAALTPYHASVSKTRPNPDPSPSEGFAKSKLLPGHALGTVMISYGENLQFMARERGGNKYRLGEMMERVGKARCNIAEAQIEFAHQLETHYLSDVSASIEMLDDYQEQKKKVDSRRLALDAVSRKISSSKKESKSLDEELSTAQDRFHEAQEQALVQMAEVKECESQQMAQLSEMIDQELEFARQYYTIMNELRSSLSQPTANSTNRPRSKSTSAVPKNTLSTSSRQPSSSRLSSMLNVARPSLSRSGSSKPTSDDEETSNAGGKESSSARSNKANRNRSFSNASAGSMRSSFMPKLGSIAKRTGNNLSSFSSNKGSKEQYGSLDDQDGLRATGTERLNGGEDDDGDDDGDSRDSEQSLSRQQGRLPMPGRARSHSTLSSGTARFIPPNGGADSINSPNNIGRSTPPSYRRHNTTPLNPSATSGVSDTIIESRESHEGGRQDLRIALYDYIGKASDELTVRVGDVIEVVRTVSTDWCIGENDRGESGLFPSTYTELYDHHSGVQDSVIIKAPSNRATSPPSRSGGGVGRAPLVALHHASDTETDEDPFN